MVLGEPAKSIATAAPPSVASIKEGLNNGLRVIFAVEIPTEASDFPERCWHSGTGWTIKTAVLPTLRGTAGAARCDHAVF